MQQPIPYDTGKKYYRLPDHENNTNRYDANTHRLTDPAVKAVTDTVPSSTDPLGMYTGMPEDPDTMPVQDADDL